MKSILEIIELRSAKKNKHEVISLIENLLKNELKPTDINLKIYTHATFNTDYSVHLYYQVDDETILESKLGYELSAYLRDYGLVSHNIWFEKTEEVK